MCVIIHKPAGVAIDKSILEQCHRNNPDGFGIGWLRSDGNYKVRKGVWGLDRIVQVVQSATDHEAVIHFRWATHGLKNDGNCHPFLPKLRDGQRILLAHNGVLAVSPRNSKISDTAEFALQLMEKWQTDELRDSLDTIEKWHGIGNRLCLLFPDGTVKFTGYWSDHAGCHFSNLHWQTPRRPKQTRSVSNIGYAGSGSSDPANNWTGRWNGTWQDNWRESAWREPTGDELDSLVRQHGRRRCTYSLRSGCFVEFADGFMLKGNRPYTGQLTFGVEKPAFYEWGWPAVIEWRDGELVTGIAKYTQRSPFTGEYEGVEYYVGRPVSGYRNGKEWIDGKPRQFGVETTEPVKLCTYGFVHPVSKRMIYEGQAYNDRTGEPFFGCWNGLEYTYGRTYTGRINGVEYKDGRVVPPPAPPGTPAPPSSAESSLPKYRCSSCQSIVYPAWDQAVTAHCYRCAMWRSFERVPGSVSVMRPMEHLDNLPSDLPSGESVVESRVVLDLTGQDITADSSVVGDLLGEQDIGDTPVDQSIEDTEVIPLTEVERVNDIGGSE